MLRAPRQAPLYRGVPVREKIELLFLHPVIMCGVAAVSNQQMNDTNRKDPGIRVESIDVVLINHSPDVLTKKRAIVLGGVALNDEKKYGEKMISAHYLVKLADDLGCDSVTDVRLVEMR